MEILQVKDLTFRYPDSKRDALKNLSFSVKKGEFVVICGESGCGKSTLLKLIKRELSPFGDKKGEIFYNGMPIPYLDNRTAASEIGFVMQNPENQIVTDTVWHELAFGLENLGLDTQIIRRKVAEIATYFGIEELFHKKTSELSGGHKQLLNLASVMVMQPKILLLDEPTAQLDPIAATGFIDTLKKLNRELGISILLVEHRLEEVFPIANRVLLIENGSLVYNGSPKKINNYLKNNPSHPFVAGLPASMRIFTALKGEGACPLSISEGRDYITENYDNKVKYKEEPPYNHSEQKAVELKNVWFRYQKELPDIMRGVSLTVYKGESFCILGGNGTGKTTMLNCIAGLIRHYKGKILISGKRIGDYREGSLYIKNVALLPQNPQTVFLHKTVKEDFYEVCKTMKYTSSEAESKISEIAEKFNIENLLEMHPYDLSGGEQQKAALAKILLLEPQILLLDEPTKGIDANAKLYLSEIIKKLKITGVTVITVTHDVEFAAVCADRCGLFFDGEILSACEKGQFFSENSFYTTAASRISRGHFENAILCQEVAELCKINGRKGLKTGE